MLETSIAGSLPRPDWLAEPETLKGAWKLSGQALEDGKRKGTVGFALTSLQRRLASSPEAILQSLRRRRAKRATSRPYRRLYSALLGKNEAFIRSRWTRSIITTSLLGSGPSMS